MEEVATNKSLPPDHYALYLVIGEGDSYRVLNSSDRLLAALSSVGSECHLCLKPNAFYESIRPFVSFVLCGGGESGASVREVETEVLRKGEDGERDTREN